MLFYPRPNWRTSTHSILTWDIKFARWPVLSQNKTPCYPGYSMMSIHACMWGKILFWSEATRWHLPAPLHLPNFPLVLSVSDTLWSPEITRMRALNKHRHQVQPKVFYHRQGDRHGGREAGALSTALLPEPFPQVSAAEKPYVKLHRSISSYTHPHLCMKSITWSHSSQGSALLTHLKSAYERRHIFCVAPRTVLS